MTRIDRLADSGSVDNEVLLPAEKVYSICLSPSAEQAREICICASRLWGKYAEPIYHRTDIAPFHTGITPHITIFGGLKDVWRAGDSNIGGLPEDLVNELDPNKRTVQMLLREVAKNIQPFNIAIDGIGSNLDLFFQMLYFKFNVRGNLEDVYKSFRSHFSLYNRSFRLDPAHLSIAYGDKSLGLTNEMLNVLVQDVTSWIGRVIRFDHIYIATPAKNSEKNWTDIRQWDEFGFTPLGQS